MAPNLRAGRRSRASAGRGGGGTAAEPCPVCLEPLTENQFRFPCGHGVCTGCNGRLAQRRFLSCPTCRTPREGVSERQVERANHARAREDQGVEEGEPLVVFAGGREFQVLFFPDESDGQHPFAPLGGPPGTLHEVRPGGGARRARTEAAPAAGRAAGGGGGPGRRRGQPRAGGRQGRAAAPDAARARARPGGRADAPHDRAGVLSAPRARAARVVAKCHYSCESRTFRITVCFEDRDTSAKAQTVILTFGRPQF